MKNRDKTIVPRNPFAVAARQRVSGAHEKSVKALRQKRKQELLHALKWKSFD